MDIDMIIYSANREISRVKKILDDIQLELNSITNKYKSGWYLCTEDLYMNSGELAYKKGHKYECVDVDEFNYDIIDENKENHSIPFNHEWFTKFIYIENEK